MSLTCTNAWWGGWGSNPRPTDYENVTISATGGMTVFVPGSPQQAFTELSDAVWQAKRQGVPYTTYKAGDSE